MSQRHPLVKICGNVYPEESLRVAAVGPDLMGWIYSPLSPRRVGLENARRQMRGIRAEFPRIRHVAVFARNTLPEIAGIVRRTPELDLLQIVEGAGFVSEIGARLSLYPDSAARGRRGARPDLLPVLRVDEPVESQELDRHAPWPLILFDSRVAGRAGGTGVRFDPRFAAGATRPFLIAGGLRPENVRDALRLSGAVGADVSSGVEYKGRPGRKDPELLRAFVENARAARG